jgi:hypothetical protein
MESIKKYKIQVTEGYGDFIEVYELDLETDRIDWSLKQYARHRKINGYKILEIDGVVQTDDSSSL